VAATAFLSTNLDNATVTVAMVAAAPAERSHRIAVGQVIGFVVLVVVATAAAILLFEFSPATVGLLGLVPLALGLRGFVLLRRGQDRTTAEQRAVGSGVIAALLLTIAAGGDNLAVYIPLFRVGGGSNIVAIAVVFGIGEILLTVFVLYAGNHPQMRRVSARLGAIALPILMCAVGVLVMLRAGTLAKLF
jgi:cadmium resistance protein CadD (predicted permease)